MMRERRTDEVNLKQPEADRCEDDRTAGEDHRVVSYRMFGNSDDSKLDVQRTGKWHPLVDIAVKFYRRQKRSNQHSKKKQSEHYINA